MESRKDKFKRLAEKRTTEVLEKLRILGNLSNKSSYEFYEDDINKIFKAIDEQVRLMKSRFKISKISKFKL